MLGCDREWFEAVSAWHDGEVGAADAARIEAHVSSCAACRRAAGMLASVGESLQRRRQDEVPATLRQRVAAARPRRVRRVAWAAAAAAALLVASASAWPRPALGQALTDEAVAHHVKGFAREKPCDFESADRAEVAQWIEGRLGYHVDVPVPEGASLLGARVCNIGGVKTAALMYRREGAAVTIFVPPQGSQPAEKIARFSGRCTAGALSTGVCAAQSMLVVSEADPRPIAASLAR